jgi:hypothetical protein
MRPLFISYVCDYCDGLADPGPLAEGWVVWRDRPPGSEEYVFRTRDDAERWRAAKGYDDCPIRRVCSASEFRWRKSTGSLTDIELADHLFEIFPHHRYPAGGYRAHLAA